MARYDASDLMLTSDGDLVLGEDGDLALVEGPDFVAQSVYNRLRSVTVDWFYDHIGADLEDFLGRPNTRETAGALAEQVKGALVNDGLIDAEDVFIKPVPLDRTVVGLFVFVRVPGIEEPIGFQVTVDLDGGAQVRRIRREGAW